MNQWLQFLWLCKMAVEFILLPPLLIAFIVLCISLACACLKQRPFQRGLWRGSYWLVFTQLLFYPALIAVAVLGGVNFMPGHEPNKVAALYFDILSWTSLALAIFWVWHMKGLRWVALSVIMLEELLLLGAFLTADMAVSGRWL